MGNTIPKITWGAGFTGSLEIGFPLDFAVSYSKPREGSERAQFISGEEDSWIVGTDYILEGQARWIPIAATTSSLNVAQAGWDGALGFRAFLEWAKTAQQFRYIPDRDSPGTYVLSTLVEPIDSAPTLEPADGTRTIRLIIRNPTNPYDG